jgi:predicted Ser/Thr protein kinase
MNKTEALELYNKREFISKGKRGLISVSTDGKGKKHCIKEKNPSSGASNRIQIEFENNKKLNEIGVGPKIHFYDGDKDFLIRDFVDGENILGWIGKNKGNKDIIQKLKKIIINILDQCRRMDRIGMNKMEMTNPHKDIIIDEKDTALNPVIIDFERCRFAARPKNVTQFCQFLTKGNMRTKLEKNKIFLDKENILNLAEAYKNNNSDENYIRIIGEIEKSTSYFIFS